MKKRILCHLLVVLFAFTSYLQAGTKEELQALKQDVLTLQKQFREFEKTLNDYNTGLAGIKSLIEQLNDQAAKSNMLLDRVVAVIEKQSSEDSSQEDKILQGLQTLSNKNDEMATSLGALARQVSELKVQSMPINPPVSTDLTSADTVFNQAFYDLIEENYELAIGGFNAYLTQFPSGDKAAAAKYNIGEAYYYMNRFEPAISAFTQVIDENTDSDKVASALYKRGKAFLGNQDSERAVEDFKLVIGKFPDAPEAALSKSALQDLGMANER